jgi:hypothetical protein
VRSEVRDSLQSFEIRAVSAQKIQPTFEIKTLVPFLLVDDVFSEYSEKTLYRFDILRWFFSLKRLLPSLDPRLAVSSWRESAYF